MSPKSDDAGSVMELLRLAADIREKLGSQGHLMEQYLTELLTMLTASSGYQAGEAGYEESAKLRKLCFYAIDVRAGMQEEKGMEIHPFYPAVKKHFEDNPDTSRSRFAIVNRHFVMLSPDFLKASLSSYLREQADNLNCLVNKVLLDRLYSEITSIVGKPVMEPLSRAIKEQFFAVPLSTCFAYGFSFAVAECLDYVDRETDRQIFKLLMDELRR